ncbi:MAG: ATP-binding protein [Phycisphaerales bacterium]|nr:ATP-binding protein [Phycisphaerales bacterium]
MSGRGHDAISRSVHDRLLKLAASRKEDFNAILTGYRRCRIYTLLEGSDEFEGVYAKGMEPVKFVGIKIPRHGEPFSKRTLDAKIPCVHKAPDNPSDDQYAEILNKKPGVPWIDIPLIIGDQVYGRISIDNQDHPLPHRLRLKREFEEQTKREKEKPATMMGELMVLQSIALQLSWATRHTKIRQEISYLLAGYVHDTKGRLGMLEAKADILYDQEAKEQHKQAYADISAIINSMRAHSTMAARLSEMFRSSQRPLPLKPEHWDVATLVQEVFRWCSVRANALGCSLKQQGEAKGYLDKTIVQQIMLVFLSNALQSHTDRSDRTRRLGSVTVTVAKKDNMTIIKVTDDGRGVSPEIASRLFHEQISNSHGDGMGVGLLMASWLASLHGGKVWLAENIPTEKVTFVVTLQDKVNENK